MKHATSISLLSLFLNNVSAFPGIIDSLAKQNIAGQKRQGGAGIPDLTPTFNEKLQHVSTTGKHAFVAPDLAGGDQRGPCPGLNAMANHGYLPHNGVGSHLDFIQGTYDGEILPIKQRFQS